MSLDRTRPAASRRTRLFGLLVAGHGLFVLLKLLGIAGVVAALGAVQMRFGWDVAAVSFLHVAVIAAIALAFRRCRQRSAKGSTS